MEASADAAALSRSLYAIARTELTGIVSITAPERRCQLLLVRGQVRAALGSDDERASLPATAEQRLAAVLRWGAVRCHVEASATCAAHRSHATRSSASSSMGELLLGAAELAVHAGQAESAQANPARTLEATAFGRALMQAGVELVPGAFESRLTEGVCSRELLAATEPDALLRRRIRAALRIAAVVPAARDNRIDYALLLRKREQLRRCVSPRELLELSPDANAAEAGKALRRLAARVHPDALGPDAPAVIHDLSSDSIRELVRAENALRGRARTRAAT